MDQLSSDSPSRYVLRRALSAIRWVLAGWLLLSTSSARSAPDLCDADAACRGYSERGANLADQKNYSAALREFERAYQRKPEPRLLINIGRCLFRMGRARESLEYFDRALKAMPDADAQLRRKLQQNQADANAALDAERLLTAQKSGLLVRAAELGAAILLDGREIGKTPMGRSIEVNPGTHHVEVNGAQRHGRYVELAPGQDLVIGLGVPEFAPVPARKPRPRWRLGLGGASIAVGVTLIAVGIAALSIDGRCVTAAQDGLCDFGFNEQGQRSAAIYDSASTGWGLVASGGVLATAGIVLMAIPGSRNQEAPVSQLLPGAGGRSWAF